MSIEHKSVETCLYPSSSDRTFGKISDNKTFQREFFTSKFPKCVLKSEEEESVYFSSLSVKEQCTFTSFRSSCSIYVPKENQKGEKSTIKLLYIN